MKVEKLASKYHGSMASTYDELREGTPQWLSEQRIVEQLLSSVRRGASVLDVPVGTGRFLRTYLESGFKVTGVDVSKSMLAKAREKSAAQLNEVDLREGSIFSLDFSTDSFDVVVCMRFMDWVDAASLRIALAELVRVCKDTVIVSIPTFMQIAEIRPHTIQGLATLFRQLKLRIYLWRTRSDGIIHNKDVIFDLFETHGLRILDRVCVDQASEKPRTQGVRRDVYLLRVRKSDLGTRDRQVRSSAPQQ